MTTAPADLYEQDFYAWTRVQAQALRRLAATRPNEPVDWPRLIEEVADLGKSERDTVRSQLRRLIEHLLKLEFSPSSDPRAGWVNSVLDARDALGDKLSPTLRRDLSARLDQLYRAARDNAALRLRLYGEAEAAGSLPATCPYTLGQLVDRTWFPKNRHGLPDLP